MADTSGPSDNNSAGNGNTLGTVRGIVCAVCVTAMVLLDKVPGLYGIAGVVVIAVPSTIQAILSLKGLLNNGK